MLLLYNIEENGDNPTYYNEAFPIQSIFQWNPEIIQHMKENY